MAEQRTIALFLAAVSSDAPMKKAPRLGSQRAWVLAQVEPTHMVSMKLRSLSLRLGCLSLRKALASI